MCHKSNLDEHNDDEGDDHGDEGDYDENYKDDEVTCWKQPSQVLTLRIKHSFWSSR